VSNTPTPRQQQIIDEPGNLLVVAGPGSGKTATMVLKIQRILQTPSHIAVAVTFTRDGANELRGRLAKTLTPAQTRRVTVDTFHALTIQHLRRHNHLARVATPQQQSAFLQRARAQFAPEVDANDMRLAFESVKCSMKLTPELKEVSTSAWFLAYQETLKRHNMIDLLDVMREGVQLMARGEIPPLSCTHLVVDEAQDNDEIQAAWVSCHKDQIVTMVGDDDQTIFEWRRAIGFPGMKRFQELRNARVVLLEDNFRSKAEVLAAAGAVIACNNPYRNDKMLVPRRGDGGTVTRVATGSTEATCAAVEQLLAPDLIDLPEPSGGATHGVKTGTWAVLARTNLLLDVVESCLEDAQIKSFRSSGSLWDHYFAQTALQMLNALLNHDTVGIDIGMHHAKIKTEDVSAVIEANRTDIGALLDGAGDLAVTRDKRVADLFGRTAKWRKLIADGSFSSAVDRVCDFVLAQVPGSKRGTAEMILSALSKRLNRMNVEPAQRVAKLLNDARKRSADHAVALYTMHGSKGLEFDNVVIVGCDAGQIPGEAVDLPPGAAGIQPGQSTVQSERRLFYVAMTRAKDRLWLVHSYSDPSLFIDELPSWVQVIRVSGGSESG
jgi:superfamily I DNA/RNA helicase